MKLFLFISSVIGSCHAKLVTNYEDDRMAAIYQNNTDASMFENYDHLHSLLVKPDSAACHGWDWFYCPRDPGCTDYVMSAHQVSVGTAPSHLAKVTVGAWTNLYVIGETTLKEVPVSASYKVYGVDGKNVASGALPARHGIYNDGPKGLGASLELNFENKPNQFRLQVPLIVQADNFDETTGTQWVNFGIDVFLEPSGTHEAICVQVANEAYATTISKRASPAFEMLCEDNGDGTFTPGAVPDVLHPLGGCNEFGKQCDGCMTTCNPQSRAATLVQRTSILS